MEQKLLRLKFPPYIKSELKEKLGFYNNEFPTGTSLLKKCKEINDFIKLKYKTYEKFFNPKSHKNKMESFDKSFPYISSKSLERYLKLPDVSIAINKLYMILAFLGYPPNELDSVIEKRQTYLLNEIPSDALKGGWYLYVHDSTERNSSKIKRTPLYLWHDRSNPEKLRVEYKSVWGITFLGEAFISNKSLTIILNSRENFHLFFCAELPELKDEKIDELLILNASSLSNGYRSRTVSADIILIKAHTQTSVEETVRKKFFSDNLVTRISIKPDNPLKTSAKQRKMIENENLIIYYLSRGIHKDKAVKVFMPNSFTEIQERNDKAYKLKGRNNYEKLKYKFKSPDYLFIAFNRARAIKNEIAIFKYEFEFLDEEKKVMVLRHPLNQVNQVDFEGEAFLEGEKLYLELRDYNLQRRKQLIAPFNSSAENFFRQSDNELRKFLLEGITSSISPIEAKHIALRELIICFTKKGYEELKNSLSNNNSDRGYEKEGFISYETFLSINENLLKSSEKLYLANELLSTLTFPSASDARFSHSRQDKAIKYSGKYHVFSHFPGTDLFLRMILQIDVAAQVVLKIRFHNDAKIYMFSGVCEFFNHNLHISTHLENVHPSEQNHCDFICDYIKEGNRNTAKVFKGLMLTTNDDNDALSLPFIAIEEGENIFQSVVISVTQNLNKDFLDTPDTIIRNDFLKISMEIEKKLGIMHLDNFLG